MVSTLRLGEMTVDVTRKDIKNVHLIEPTHNSRFIETMDRLMPAWRHSRQILNRLPLRHATWEY